MSFDPDWLALRAPADDRARDAALRLQAEALLGAREAPLIVDLGCGSGATLRVLGHCGARWRLVDQDPELLARAGALASAAGVEAETMALDLAGDGDGLERAVAGADLVTASALFDLASAGWIDRLVGALPPGAGLYAALSYSGRMLWSPHHAQDLEVEAFFNRHQQGDKGFGPALGPAAADRLAARLEADGRRTRAAPSDWRLSAEPDGALIAELARGIAAAASEAGLDLAAWSAARRETTQAVISHLDVFAEPRA